MYLRSQLAEPRPVRRVRPYLAASAMAAALVFLALGTRWVRASQLAKDTADRAADVARGTQVVVAPVQAAPATRSFTLTCDVRPYQRVQLLPNINGFVRALDVDKGQAVHAGEVLAVLQAPDADERLRAAKLDYGIKSQLLARSNKLHDASLLSAQDMDRVRSDAAQAHGEVARLEALKAYQFLRAPFDGVVVGRYADPGALLVVPPTMEGSTPVLEVWDTSRLRVQGHVGQAEAPFVHAGDVVKIWSDERPLDVRDATITRATGALDPKTRTMLAEIELADPGALLPGSFAHVTFTIPSPAAVAIPVDAVTTRKGETVVLVVKGGRGTFRKVRLDWTDGRTVRVLEGLAPGELVALFPSDALADGAALHAVLADGKPAEVPHG